MALTIGLAMFELRGTLWYGEPWGHNQALAEWTGIIIHSSAATFPACVDRHRLLELVLTC
jgi:hypothetical protein